MKDDVSGIGTVTFVDGTNFMALGHSVSDIDTGVMMRCSTGGVYTTDITNISKSYSSEPGRLQEASHIEDLWSVLLMATVPVEYMDIWTPAIARRNTAMRSVCI